MHSTPPIASDVSPPTLVPLSVGLKRYSVPRRTGRRLIREGKLPATKIGREYFVSPADVAELFKPRLVMPTVDATRETPTQREARQLARAGISAPKKSRR